MTDILLDKLARLGTSRGFTELELKLLRLSFTDSSDSNAQWLRRSLGRRLFMEHIPDFDEPTSPTQTTIRGTDTSKCGTGDEQE
jgi:hypothetical protein